MEEWVGKSRLGDALLTEKQHTPNLRRERKGEVSRVVLDKTRVMAF